MPKALRTLAISTTPRLSCECIRTIQGQSIWWWSPGQTFKSLRELQIEYDNSVGHNANLLLGVTPDFTGSLPAAHVARYTEFGDWIRECYGKRNMIAEKTGVTVELSQGTSKSVSVVLQLPSKSTFDRLWIMEEISHGQKIVAFTLEIQQVRNPTLSLAWPVSCDSTNVTRSCLLCGIDYRRRLERPAAVAVPLFHCGCLRWRGRRAAGQRGRSLESSCAPSGCFQWDCYWAKACGKAVLQPDDRRSCTGVERGGSSAEYHEGAGRWTCGLAVFCSVWDGSLCHELTSGQH